MSHDIRSTASSVSNGETRTSSLRYEWNRSGELTVAVVEAVATATDREAIALPPLERSVDTDALDALVRSAGDGLVRLSFAYAGTDVSVDADGSITVRPRELDRA